MKKVTKKYFGEITIKSVILVTSFQKQFLNGWAK